LAGNSRGYDWDDTSYVIENYQTIYGVYIGQHTTQGEESVHPSDFADVDWATVTVVYPDGHMETRTFVGPWDDLDQFEDEIEEWYEEGTP
jgi:hypothetical protein